MHNILAVLQGTSTTLSADALDRIFQFINNVGAPYAVLFGILFIAYKLIKPVSDAFVENNRVVRAGLKTSTDTLVKVAEIMEKRETRLEAETRTDDAAKAINEHTDEATQPVAEGLDKVLQELTEIKNILGDMATKEQMERVIREISKLQPKPDEKAKTSEMPPVVTDPAPPAQVASAERVEGSS